LIVASIATVAPIICGHGIPEAGEAVLRRQSRIPPRAAIAKPLASAITIGTGGPFGAEGPIIVTGGAIGSIVGQALRVTASERKILLASGAGAGMTATFGSPLAAILFVVELPLFELSMRTLIPLVVATSIAGGIHSAVFGTGPLFNVPPHDYAGLGVLPLYAVLGVASGLVAVVIAKGLFQAERSFRSLRVPIFWHPLIGALVFARFGGVFAAVVLQIVPGLEISEGAFAVVAMAAVFGAAARAPLTSIVFVFELTRDFNVMLATVLAALVFSALSSESISTKKLSRRGIRVGRDLVADSLRTTAVADVMNRVVDTVGPRDTVGSVADRITRGERGAFPIVDEQGRCLGIVERRDLITKDRPRNALVQEIASSDVVTIGPDASLVDALRNMTEEEVTHLPVVQDGRLVRICTRADIARSRRNELALERFDQGWLAPVLQRRDRVGPPHIIVGNESLGGTALMAELQRLSSDRSQVRFHVIVPLAVGGDLPMARERLELQLGLIETMGVSATGEIGDADPIAAIEASLAIEAAVGVVLSTRPARTSRWQVSGVPSGIARRVDIPCVVATNDEIKLV
jgi:CIC family chloride channel protein